MNTSSLELVGLLRRQIRTRVLNVSLSGCLLETAAPMEVGSACELRVELNNELLVDDIRVTRCVAVQGAGSTYRVGAQFLWTSNPRPHSLRRLAAGLRVKRFEVPAVDEDESV